MFKYKTLKIRLTKPAMHRPKGSTLHLPEPQAQSLVAIKAAVLVQDEAPEADEGAVLTKSASKVKTKK